MKHLLTSIIILLSLTLLPCDCKDLGPLENLRAIDYEFSDIVFLGELIENDSTTSTFVFEIKEIFKGECKAKLIKGKRFGSCSIFPRDKCLWIIYAELDSFNQIYISGCGASRSKENPENIQCYKIPPPPPPNQSEQEEIKYMVKFIQHDVSIKIKALIDWKKEIELLRNKKILAPK